MIEAAVTLSGTANADVFLLDLEQRGGRRRRRENLKRASEVALVFEDYADNDDLEIPRELNFLRDGIAELKAGDVRLPFFDVEASKSGAVRLTHGFLKAQTETPREEIDKALWVRREDGEVDARDKPV